MSGAVLTRAERIARLNDLARRAMGIACVVVATEGIRALPEVDQSRLRELIESFDAFTPDNDPYGERDFGAIYRGLDGVWSASRPADVAVTVFWKIDAYDRALRFGSEDPAGSRRDPAGADHHVGERVLIAAANRPDWCRFAGPTRRAAR